MRGKCVYSFASFIGEALKVNDCLLDITKRYNDVVNGTEAKGIDTSATQQSSNQSADLLTNNKFSKTSTSAQAASTLDELNEIFSSHSTSTPTPFDVTALLKPISVKMDAAQSGKAVHCTISVWWNRILFSSRISCEHL